jgi:lipopolysaccharide/colanic/teichoic acid biosynthesis glycosyltransferase/NDP-sugar pyrophosphorylase family protein
MRAVILLGGVSAWLYPLSYRRPRAMLPVGNAPVLKHLLDHLFTFGVSEFFIPLPPHARSVQNYFGSGHRDGCRIHYSAEKKVLGTAGCLRLFEPFLKDEPFLVASGNVYSQLDLSALLALPSQEKPFVVVGMQRDGRAGSHARAARQRPSDSGVAAQPRIWEENAGRLGHVYWVHPAVLDLIPPGRYYDLREQLIPAALSGRFDVRGIDLPGSVNDLRTFQNYLDANTAAAKASGPAPVGGNVWISKTASLHGPVLIGANTRIGPHSVVVGPAVIGENCRIGRGVFLHESVVNSKVHVGNLSHIQKSILVDGAHVRPKSHLWQTLALNGGRFPGGHENLLEHGSAGRGWDLRNSRPRFPVTRGLIFHGAKRAVDLIVTLLLSPAVGAACLVFGALTQATSPGPMFYRETRLGWGGRPFTLWKLRTMVQGADRQQSVLRAMNQTDGPMFKIIQDPRVTRLGRWLRQTSLDELPQFWNVLKGDMALVGPRPLADREMKWHPAWRELRLRVKPGLTGLWQVRCGVASDFAEWIAYDVEYVQNLSLWQDLRILAATVRVVLTGRRTV